ncbi:hypothetical protein D3C78_1052450 [compost metagenome]
MFQAVDVDLVLEGGAAHPQGAAADLHQIGAAGQHGLLAHPHQGGLELVGHRRRRVGQGEQVAPADIDLVLQGQGHRLAAERLLLLAGHAEDAGDPALLAGRQDADAVADAQAAGGDVAGETAEVEVRPVHPLHRHAERRAARPAVVQRGAFQMLQQAGALVPRHAGAAFEQVVTLERGERDAVDVGQPELGGEGAVLGLDVAEHRLRIVHQVHLVHRHQHLTDA